LGFKTAFCIPNLFKVSSAGYAVKRMPRAGAMLHAALHKRGFFKSRMTFEKATLNLRTFCSASCGTQEARENARGLSKLTEF
jgi:hypothetical protein